MIEHLLEIIQGCAAFVLILACMRVLSCTKRAEFSFKALSALTLGAGAALGLSQALHGTATLMATLTLAGGAIWALYMFVSRGELYMDVGSET